MQNPFTDILKGKTVIVGIGNSLRGDDGLGPELILKLQGKLKAVCIDAGNSPESYTGKIVKENPDTILLVDAVHLNLPPGQYRLLIGFYDEGGDRLPVAGSPEPPDQAHAVVIDEVPITIVSRGR